MCSFSLFVCQCGCEINCIDLPQKIVCGCGHEIYPNDPGWIPHDGSKIGSIQGVYSGECRCGFGIYLRRKPIKVICGCAYSLWGLLPISKWHLFGSGNTQEEEEEDNRRQCPYCGSKLNSIYLVCSHCQRDIVTGERG